METGQVESVDIINKLKNITDSTYITFKDNSKLKIDNETASVILNVYENLNDENKNIINKISKSLNKYDYKLFMMENLGYLLPPLNNFKKFKKLDDWEKTRGTEKE